MAFKEKEYNIYLDELGIDPETKRAYVKAVKDAFRYFEGKGLRYEDVGVSDFEGYIEQLMERGENTENNILGVARYVHMQDMKDVWIYFASIIGGRNILPSIAERLEKIAGEEAAKDIFSNVKAPPLGSKPDKYCDATSNLMKEFMEKLSPQVYRRVLAGNHHRIPLEAFEKHKKWLVEEGDVEAWLKRMHDAAVAELEEFLREDKVWYEQVITQDIVDYVKCNQEVLSGVRVGDWIYNTKFPYAPQDYLDDPFMVEQANVTGFQISPRIDVTEVAGNMDRGRGVHRHGHRPRGRSRRQGPFITKGFDNRHLSAFLGFGGSSSRAGKKQTIGNTNSIMYSTPFSRPMH